MTDQFLCDFVASELAELETRDIDQLFECLVDNLEEINTPFSRGELYNEIERQVDAERMSNEQFKRNLESITWDDVIAFRAGKLKAAK